MRKIIKGKLGKIFVISMFSILIAMSATQAFVKYENGNLNKLEFNKELPSFPLSNDPFFTWEDNFDTIEWIDNSMSNDFEVVDGVAQIKNTYEVWTDPDWTKLKPITLTNNAESSLTDYAFSLSVEYDSDMQEYYDDIRFKHEDYPTTWLDYYIETKDTTSADVWVNIPEVPTGISMLYLFYGNPDATDESDFYSVFSDWEEEWDNDERISYHTDQEGAWDPDVQHGVDSNGDDIFIIAWEEGTAYHFPTTVFRQEIRGSIYDIEGNCDEFDFTIFTENKYYYRNENPSVAFGGEKFFVAFENYINPVNNDYIKRDLKGALVQTDGDVEDTFNICIGSDIAADPNVAFDTINDQFCVVWEDAREGFNNFDIYGKLYDTNGDQIGSEKEICTGSNSQHEPWIAFDQLNEQYLIVWEEGETPDEGPFSIHAGFFDENLNQIGDTIIIATGNNDKDYNFPCVCFSEETECFLITYNDCDLSDDDWYGSIWGIILDTSGDIIVDTFSIKNGNFIRTDIVSYLSSSFFVSYDDEGSIWGKLVSSEGEVFSDDIQMSASTSAVADWANMDVCDEKIFISWEDTRIYYPPPFNQAPDVYSNMWNLNIPSSSQVSSEFGTEKELILSAQVTSKAVEPDNLLAWIEFGVEYEGSISYDILDADGAVLILDANNGEDLTNIDPEIYPALRLQGHFSRDNPSDTPTLDIWGLTYAGIDEVPPDTAIGEIIGDQGLEEWYISNVKIVLNATDGLYGSGVNHTYFKIGNESIQEYDPQVGIRLPQHATGDPNTPHGEWDVWYWSVDKANNEESLKGPINIRIDKVMPHCEIWDPPDRANVPMSGNFLVQANAVDNGSGIHYVSFDVGPPYDNPVKIYDDDPPGSGNYKWLCDRHFNKKQWRHIIAQVHDYAGHMYEHNIYVYFSAPTEYNPGYVYFFGNSYGPFFLMSIFDIALTIDQSNIPIVLQDISLDATHVDIIAKRCILKNEFKFSDNDLSDGCYCEVDIPIGLYSLKARIYENSNLIEERKIISKMIVILI